MYNLKMTSFAFALASCLLVRQPNALQKQSKVHFMVEMGSTGSNLTNTTRLPIVRAGEL